MLSNLHLLDYHYVINVKRELLNHICIHKTANSYDLQDITKKKKIKKIVMSLIDTTSLEKKGK